MAHRRATGLARPGPHSRHALKGRGDLTDADRPPPLRLRPVGHQPGCARHRPDAARQRAARPPRPAIRGALRWGGVDPPAAHRGVGAHRGVVAAVAHPLDARRAERPTGPSRGGRGAHVGGPRPLHRPGDGRPAVRRRAQPRHADPGRGREGARRRHVRREHQRQPGARRGRRRGVGLPPLDPYP